MPGLLIDIAANVARMQSDMNRASKSVRSFADKSSRSLNLLRNSFIALGGAYGVKSVIGSLYDAGVAAERMELQLKAATGTVDSATDAWDYLRDASDKLGLTFETQVDGFVKLAASAKGTNLEGQATRDIWVSVAEAGAALQLRSDELNGALVAISQIMSKGKVSAEELRQQLGERLPGAFQIAARSMGVTTAELDKMLSTGKLMADDFLPRFAAEMHKTFGKAAVDASDSATASMNRLHNEWNQFTRDLGTAFLPAAVAMIKKLNEAFEGARMLFAKDELSKLQRRKTELIAIINDLENPGRLRKFTARIGGEDLAGELEAAKKELQEISKLMFDLENAKPASQVIPPLISGGTNQAGALGLTDQQVKAQEETFNNSIMSLEEYYEQTGMMQLNAMQLAIERKREEEEYWIQFTIDRANKELEIENEKNKQMKVLREQEKKNMISNAMFALQYFGQYSKTAFKAYQALAIAQTIVDTYKAAQGAYSAMASIPYVGPALGIAAAAAATAAGLARVDAIRSQSPGGAGGAISAGGGQAIGSYPASPTTGLPEIGGAGEEQRGTLTINIQGDFIGDESYIEMLIEKITGAVEEKDVRLVATSSKYAELIQ